MGRTPSPEARPAPGPRLNMAAARGLWDLDLLILGREADLVRRRLNPEDRVTYVVDRNINYTNICTSGCRFCAYYRELGSPEGFVLDEKALAQKLIELKDHGGSGVLLQGGLNPNLPFAYYEDLVRQIKASGLGVHGFSPPEIAFMSQRFGMPIKEVIARLIAEGLRDRKSVV